MNPYRFGALLGAAVAGALISWDVAQALLGRASWAEAAFGLGALAGGLVVGWLLATGTLYPPTLREILGRDR